MKKTLALLALTAFAFGHFVAPLQAEEEAAEIKITVKDPLLYDIKEIAVKPGQKVKLTLVVPANLMVPQPHNLLIVKPGKMQAVGMASLGMAADPKAVEKSYVPESDDILFHTSLVQLGAEETIEFTAPAEAGDYPYLCTFPGHFATMNGVMKVQ